MSPAALDDNLIAVWQQLSERALEPNAYLTPMFILPALAHLGSPTPVSILLIEHADGRLLGIGIFATKLLLPLLPVQSLLGFRSKHSFLSCLLIDREQATSAVDAFFTFVSRPGTGWHGVRFDWLHAESALAALLLSTARRRNIWWSESERVRRAVLLPGGKDAQTLVNNISSSRLKDLQRSLRRLSARGSIDWRIQSGQALSDAVIERFLALEHMGWKGEVGTSVRSNAADEQFFTTMIAGFRAAGGVFFTELLLDGQVIASTCNLISGNSAFAFKLGWDPAYAKYAPGLLNELFLLQNVQAKFSHLDFFDSGAVEGSFIDALWCDKRVLVSGVFATSLIGKLIFTSAALRRHLRRFGSTVHSATHHAIQTAWLRIA